MSNTTKGLLLAGSGIAIILVSGALGLRTIGGIAGFIVVLYGIFVTFRARFHG